MQFGEVDIDGSLVASKLSGAEDILLLNNGCLCCTVRGDLLRMLSELLTKKRNLFDHVIIETTGKLLTCYQLTCFKVLLSFYKASCSVHCTLYNTFGVASSCGHEPVMKV